MSGVGVSDFGLCNLGGVICVVLVSLYIAVALAHLFGKC